MPSVADFKKKQMNGSRSSEVSFTDKVKGTGKIMDKKAEKRRPGRESGKEGGEAAENAKKASGVKVVDVDAEASTSTTSSGKTETEVPNTKVEINFPGSEVLRAKFPKSFNAIEQVATDWVNDGKFDHIDVVPPLARAAVQQGLSKAKQIEKKVLASPVTEKVTMQAFTYAMKAQKLVGQLKAKVQKK